MAAVAVLVLLTLAPYLPAGWRALEAFDRVGVDTAGPRGFVTVQTCQRATLWAWSCAGAFEPDDPMAQPYPLTPGVALADDAGSHAPGEAVSVTLAPGSHDAYRYGRVAQGRTLFLGGGVALALAALTLGLGRRFHAKLATATLALSILTLLVARPL